MAATWTNAQQLAPGDQAVQAFTDPGGAIMTAAYAQLNAAMWTRNNPTDTSLLDLGAQYLALHMFTVGNKTGGSGGPDSQHKAGDISRIMDVMQEDPVWDSTPYGRQFRGLMRTLNIESRWLVSGGAGISPLYPFGRSFIP